MSVFTIIGIITVIIFIIGLLNWLFTDQGGFTGLEGIIIIVGGFFTGKPILGLTILIGIGILIGIFAF